MFDRRFLNNNFDLIVYQYINGDKVQDIYEEQEFWMTRIDWVGIRINQFEILKNMKIVYQDENNVVLVEKSVEWKKCINIENKSLELTI